MRLVTYRLGLRPRRAARGLRGDEVSMLGRAWRRGEVRELLASGRRRTSSPGGGRSNALAEVELLPPVPDPEKIICIGLNYRAHAAEAGIEPPEPPTFFAKFRNALRPAGRHGRPAGGERQGRLRGRDRVRDRARARDVAEAEALDHVAGYMLFNDLSARDLQFATPQWMPGKVFDGSAPCGPALVTPDEAGPPTRSRSR